MARAVWQATIADFAGNVQAGASLTVRDAETGNLVPLFSVREGAGGLSNPTNADPNGFVRVYVEPGRYHVKATFGSSEREWRDLVLEAEGGGGASTAEELLEILSTETVPGDFLLHIDGDGLEATNFEDAVRALNTMPGVVGASFLGFGRAVGIPVNDVARPVPYDATITQVIVLTQGGPGSMVCDIRKEVYASYPPDSGDSICASAKPTISAGIKYQDSTLTGWTTTVSAGDVLAFHLESNSTFVAVAVFVVLTPLGSVPADGMDDERVRELVEEALEDGGVTVIGSTYNVTAFGASGPVNLWTLVGQPTGAVTVNYETPPGGIYSNIPGIPALDLRGFASGSTLNVTLRGPVMGTPGEGGDGCAIGSTFGEDGGSGRRGLSGNLAQPGRDGGNAIEGPGAGITFNLSAINGYAFGGGGGGGGGGGSLDFAGDANSAAGGGGGAGAGGGRGGRGGRVASSDTSAAATATGQAGDDSTGGLSGAPGGGGAGAGSGSGTGDDGGAGGDFGEDGAAGDSPTTYDRDFAGAPGGIGGKAIELNGGSVTITDGNDSTHIKGDVS
jgi:hypothetical protein